MKPISKLGIGPMSGEVIEAVYRYSQRKRKPLMLIASKNQIDWDRGYVNNWSTQEFADYTKKLKKQYPRSRVFLCRDHCGPGFKNDDLKDVYKTFDSDLENGFDLIHVDFCHYKGDRDKMLRESKKAIKHIINKNPKIMIEIGTDENKGEFLDDTKLIREDMKFFTDLADIYFFVCQTGSLIREINQVGDFNHKFISKIRKIARDYKVNLKEHNADYLSSPEIKKRKNRMDAVNVAPQYGVIQTQLTLKKCLTYGIDFTDFLEESYKSHKWKKWMYKNTPHNKFLCSIVAGHYNFAKDEYKKLYDQINRHEDLRENIVQAMMRNFEIYVSNL